VKPLPGPTLAARLVKFPEAMSEATFAEIKQQLSNEHMTDLPEVRFFLELKATTVFGYYTSKIGIHDEMEYKGNRVLTEYVGCDDPTPKAT
jgi:hypothetical protein